MTRMHSLPVRLRFSPFWTLFWILFCLHQLYFGWFMVRSSFVPYVMDGNETFSVWWHSHNLYTFSFWNSFGLTDESYGLTEASHPFFHTHQGNMPRLFGFLIYALGARTVEAQVLVTTLIIGNLTLFFCYASIARVTQPLIAFVFCMFLFSDYLLYAQWHVVTYRVWYGFIFFGTLFAIAKATSEGQIGPYVLLGVLFFLAFYFELVFAGYISIAAGLYAVWLHWRSPKRVAKLYAVQAVSGISAVALLFSQLLMVFGLEVVKADFATTFLARNASVLGMTGSIQSFFQDHHIVFWNNFRDGTSLRVPLVLAQSIGNYIFQIWTPTFSMLVIIPLVGIVVSFFESETIRVAVVNSVPACGRDTGVSSHLFEARIIGPQRTRSLSWQIPDSLAQGGGWLLLAYAIVVIFVARALTLPGALFGLSPVTSLPPFWTVAWSVVTSGSLLLLVVAWATKRPVGMAVGRGVLSAMLGIIFVVKGYLLFNQVYADIWAPLFGDWKLRIVFRAATCIAFAMSVRIAASGAVESFGSLGREDIRRALIFLAVGSVSYTAIYLLSPGYVLSGYAVRYAPFAIFFIAMIPAISIYGLSSAARRFGQWVLADDRFESRRHVMVQVIVAVVIATPVLLWISVQVYYEKLFPPDQAAFLKRLEFAPLHGATFAVDNYAAPIAYYAGNWAYLDTKVSEGAADENQSGHERLQDKSSLWFADADIVQRYNRPEYYACMKMPNFDSAIALRAPEHWGSRFAFCEEEPILHRDTFDDRLIASDYPSPRFWSIVQLDPGRPKIAETTTTLSRIHDHWSIVPGVRLDQDFDTGASSTEFQLLAGSATSSCSTSASAMVVIRESDNSLALDLPPNFRGAFRLKAKVRSAQGDSRWKLGDLWIDTSNDSSALGTLSRCPAVLVDGSMGAEGSALLQSGWSRPESWGTWSTASRATLLPIAIPKVALDSDFRLDASVRAFVAKVGEVQHITVRANGVAVGEWALSSAQDQQVWVRIPKSALIGHRSLALAFDISDPASPASVGLSSDSRALGLGLMTLRIKEIIQAN